MKQVTIARLYGFVALILSALTAGPSLAEDQKFYPGSLCWPATSDAKTSIIAGTLYNDTALALQVECPIVKDAGRIKFIGIFIGDAHPTQDLSCLLTVQTSDGGIQLVKTSTLAAGGGRLDFWPTPSGLKYSFYTLACVIPPPWNGKHSSIRALWVGEE